MLSKINTEKQSIGNLKEVLPPEMGQLIRYEW